MIDESHRVSRTIDDLLELSRIELGEEPVRDVVDVADVVEGAVERARPHGRGAPDRRSRCSSAAGRRARARRPPPAGVGARQPRRERRQVQRVGLGRAGAGARRGRMGRADGRRPRDRHPGPGPRPHLRALLPRRQGPRPRHRRDRARAGDRAPRRHQPQGRGAGVVAGGRGVDVRAAHPARQRRVRRPSGGREPWQRASSERSRRRDRPIDAIARRCCVVGGRAELRRGAVDRAAPRGVHGRGRHRRVRGAGALRHRAPRPRAARRDAAPAVGHRRVPAAAQEEPGADHHGHGQGLGDRHRRRPRGRRRRLRHQAVPAARAGGPHARRAAPVAR